MIGEPEIARSTDGGERTNALYKETLRRVLWGERKGEVVEALREMGVDEGEAKELHQRAIAERIAGIRHECANKMKWGTGLVVAGIVIVICVWFMTEGFEIWCARGYRRGFFTSGRSCGDAFALVMGVMLFFGGIFFSAQGLSGWLMADKEIGPVADME